MRDSDPGPHKATLDEGPARTSEFEDWLATTLRAENALLIERLQSTVQAQFELYSKRLPAAVAERLRGEGLGHASNAAAAVKVVHKIEAPEVVAHKIESPEVNNPDKVEETAADLEAKWLEVHNKAHPVGTTGRALHAVERNASKALHAAEAASKGVVAHKQKGKRDSGAQDRKRPNSFFPEHLHTHDRVLIHPSLSKSLEDLKEHVEVAKVGVNKREYTTAKLRELAGQHSESVRKDMNIVSAFVHSNRFEFCSAVVILACTAMMVAEIQYAGYNSGFDLDVPGYPMRGTEEWPYAVEVFEAINHVFNIVFLVELLLRFAVFRSECLRNAWIYLDSFLVTCGWLDGLDLMDFGMDPMILRVARLSRMLRLLKALRAVRALDTLFLLVRSLQASLGALFWSFALLWCAQVVTGILLCQLLRDFIDDDSKDPEHRRLVFGYFGTFTHATITMFEITLANWVISCRVLYTHVSGWYGMFFILYRGCFMFAVIKVITAVFLAETARCANSDDNIAVQLKQKQKELYCRKMATIFLELDESHDGYLSAEEFAPIMTDELLKTWLTTLEIDTQDLDHLFEILDNGDDKIDLGEFTRGMTRIRGPAKSIDVLKLQVATSQLNKKLDIMLQNPLAPGLDPLADVYRSCDAGLASYPSNLKAIANSPEMELPPEPLTTGSASI